MTTPIPALLLDWIHATAPEQKAQAQELQAQKAEAMQKAEAQRARVERLKDPFMPIARKEPAALAKETILWQDDALMVIVDAFAYGPKALVIPKIEVLFPTDADEALLERLATVSAKVSDAFLALGANGAARMWINPPSALTVRQLHVHVQPGIARPSDNKVFYKKLSASLAELLNNNSEISARHDG